jgi:hypothetical protein
VKPLLLWATLIATGVSACLQRRPGLGDRHLAVVVKHTADRAAAGRADAADPAWRPGQRCNGHGDPTTSYSFVAFERPDYRALSILDRSGWSQRTQPRSVDSALAGGR